ncbi:hypothetical protein BRD00_04365 [Halobacteriales archaeon QS_8_69_26]|nr:MAG: hypothetical protein BRD00_04365 [Halobacteriales archaeon QS_8_69_26]
MTPGETATTEIVVREVQSIQFNDTPDSDDVSVDFGDVSFSTRPDGTLESFPPTWTWEGTQSSLTVTVPVTAAEDAEGGTYRFTLAVSDEEPPLDNPRTVTFNVTVEG